MRNLLFAGVAFALAILCAAPAGAQDLNRYREFELGSSTAAVQALTGVVGLDLRVVHQRPAVIQELTWRPRYARQLAGPDTESVDRVVFDFYDDRLFRITVEYDRTRTAGLTNADMIEAVSQVYGMATSAPDTALAIAEWSGGVNAIVLQRLPSYTTPFKLVITAEPTAALARTAAAQAVVLDAREAPQRDAARERQATEERRAAEEKARTTNRGTFRP